LWFPFIISFAAKNKYAPDDGKEHKESESEVSEVFHDVPECPKRRIHMEK